MSNLIHERENNQIWKQISGRDGYWVSSDGQIRTSDRMLRFIKRGRVCFCFKKGQIKTPQDNGRGYLAVSVGDGKAKKTQYVHRLVAEAFVENPHKYKCVNHKDCNKKNNSYTNLEWVTHSQNNTHAKENGRGMVKITPKQVLEIRELKKTTPVKEIAKMYGLDYRYTFRVCNLRSWKNI